MKTAGHTMGTASMTLEESMCFMASLGHQGIEVRLPKDSPLHPASGGGVDLESLKAASASLPEAGRSEAPGFAGACHAPSFQSPLSANDPK